MSEELNTKLEQLTAALARLKEAMGEIKDQLDKDGATQRFEFTFELAWKTIKNYARFKGLDTASPRDAFRVAAQLGLIDDPKSWFVFLETRNQASHIYNQQISDRVFSQIPNFIIEADKIIKNMIK